MMSEKEITEMFLEVIQERGVYAKINVSRDVVYNWKHGRGAAPTLGQMLEALYRLNKLKIHVNNE